jgi:hypothetical protein
MLGLPFRFPLLRAQDDNGQNRKGTDAHPGFVRLFSHLSVVIPQTPYATTPETNALLTVPLPVVARAG